MGEGDGGDRHAASARLRSRSRSVAGSGPISVRRTTGPSWRRRPRPRVPPPRPPSAGRAALRRLCACRARRAGRPAAAGARGRRPARPASLAGRAAVRVRGLAAAAAASPARSSCCLSSEPGCSAPVVTRRRKTERERSARARARAVAHRRGPAGAQRPPERATLGHDGYPALEVRASFSRASAPRPRRGSSSRRPPRSWTQDRRSPPEPRGPEAGRCARSRGASRRHPLAWARRPLPVPGAPGDPPPHRPRRPWPRRLPRRRCARRGSPPRGSGRAGLAGRPRRPRVDRARPRSGAGEATGAVVVLGAAPAPRGPRVGDQRAEPGSPGRGRGGAVGRTGACDPAHRSGGPSNGAVLGGGAAERRCRRIARVGVDRATAEVDLGLRLLRPEVNTLGPFEEVWTRLGPGEAWVAAGAWPVGEPLPAAAARSADGADGPPGWARSGLPMGEPLLVGRVAVGASLGSRLLAEAGLGAPSTGESDPGPG